MKATQKDAEKVIWDQMRSPSSASFAAAAAAAQSRAFPRLLAWLILFVSLTYVVYTLKLVSSSRTSCDLPSSTRRALASSPPPPNAPRAKATPSRATETLSRAAVSETKLELSASRLPRRTEIGDVVFGIAASAKLWAQRRDYIKLWYRPRTMRAVVWLDSPVDDPPTGSGLPPVRISSDTTNFSYKNPKGHRSAIRISRIVSDTLRAGAARGARWLVMGDDDTVFVADNLVRVLNKYDPEEMYYIGSLSESHLQNIFFSYGMAYGGGGFAISMPLARALEKMQDRCIQRYPGLYGSDDRIQACMAELGVPLTKEVGFHQYDVYGNLFGLLAAHPVAPLVSLHHLDVVEPIFPNMTRLEALQHLKLPEKLDSAGLMQQSICYDKEKSWTVSVSWGFAVQIFRGIFSPREIEMPSRTFLNWYRRADYTAYAFNTRPVTRNPCQKPFIFYMSKARLYSLTNQTVSQYFRHKVPHPECRWKMADPSYIEEIRVYKKPDPHIWERAPRRNCCRVLESKRTKMVVDVGVCADGEISEV